MFEKIFGIFRKGKKSDFSAEIPGGADDEMFDLGDTGMDDDFEADTISLETGMSDGGFSEPSGGMDGDAEFGDSFGDAGPAVEDEFGAGTGLEEEPPEMRPLLDEEPYGAPGAKKGKKVVLFTIVVVIVGIVAGFIGATPSSIEIVKRAISSEPTVQEQIETLTVENAELNKKLKAYRSVGTVDDILAIKAELDKRREMLAKVAAIEARIANYYAVEDRLDMVSAKLNRTKRGLLIEQGRFANVQKSLKQIEARNNYLISSTRMYLDQLETNAEKSEMLKARLNSKKVKEAETAAMMSRDVQQGVEAAAFEALSSL